MITTNVFSSFQNFVAFISLPLFLSLWDNASNKLLAVLMMSKGVRIKCMCWRHDLPPWIFKICFSFLNIVLACFYNLLGLFCYSLFLLTFWSYFFFSLKTYHNYNLDVTILVSHTVFQGLCVLLISDLFKWLVSLCLVILSSHIWVSLIRGEVLNYGSANYAPRAKFGPLPAFVSVLLHYSQAHSFMDCL